MCNSIFITNNYLFLPTFFIANCNFIFDVRKVELTVPSDVLIAIIPPDPFCFLLNVCSMTWSNGNSLKFPLDLLTEK